MSCTYQYNGMVFKDEYALDDYLMLEKELVDTYGDEVFSRNLNPIQQVNNLKLLKGDYGLEASDKLIADNKPKKALEVSEGQIVPDMEMLDDVALENYKNYISTTLLIHGLVDGNGDVLFPLFNPDEYWRRMKDMLMHASKWVKYNGDELEFTTDEALKNFITKYDIPLLFLKGVDGKYDIHDLTEEEFTKYKNKMKVVWEQQGKAGTAIHNVLSICFSKLFGKNLDTLSTKTILNEVKASKNYSSISEYLNDDLIESVGSAFKLMAIKIKTKYAGKNPTVYTELPLNADINVNGTGVKLLSRLDLVIMDGDGNIEVVDFKCSPRDFSDYNSAKIRTFEYLLSVYKRMIKNLGLIGKGHVSMSIIPIKMVNFEFPDDTLKVQFSDVLVMPDIFVNLERRIEVDYPNNPDKIENELDRIFPDRDISDVNSTELNSGIEEFLNKTLTRYSESRTKTIEKTRDWVERNCKIIELENGGLRCVRKRDNHVVIETKSNDRAKLISDLMQDWISKSHRQSEYAENVVEALEKALEEDLGTAFHIKSTNIVGRSKGKLDWMSKLLSKYATKNWKVITENDLNKHNQQTSALKALLDRGIILIKNIATGVVDVVKFSSDPHLDYVQNLGPSYRNSEYILGNFLPDEVSKNSLDSLVLKSTTGNIELMETMAALNLLHGVFNNNYVGNITVMSHISNEGYTASGKLLLYNFSRLSELGKTENNFYDAKSNKGQIKILSETEKVKFELLDIMSRVHEGTNMLKAFSTNLDEFNDLLLGLDSALGDKEKMLSRLHKLRLFMEEQFSLLKTEKLENISIEDTSHREYLLYAQILDAINELNGIDITLQVEDHSKILESSIKQVLVKGVNGSYTDNPGTLKSETLNKFSQLTERAYLRARVQMVNFNTEIQKAIKKLKESKSFTWGEKVTIGNQAKLYENLYDTSITNDLCFKDIDDASLDPAEKEFLELSLHKFAMDRYKGDVTTDGQFDLGKFSDLYRHNPVFRQNILKVPLIQGDFASSVATHGGIIPAIAAKFKQFSFKNIIRRIKEGITGILTEQEQRDIKSNKNMFTMINRIKNGFDEDTRLRWLFDTDAEGNQRNRFDEYEHNMEKLLLTHKMAYTMEDEINKIFPMMKGILLHLVNLGVILNTEFTLDIQYGMDYIKNKIFNMPLDDMEKWGAAKAVSAEIMKLASRLALAWNPKLSYLFIDGIWKDIMLYLQSPDRDSTGLSAFTKDNLIESWKFIMLDLVHTGDVPTLGESINMTYGINDMDINTLLEHLSNDNAGIYNFWSLGFRFASRPDYYNRMTIFLSLMKKDGTFEAHKMVDGKLVYDWKLDKRFSTFSKGDKSNLELYNKQKALYMAMMNEFIQEGATDENGNPLKINSDPPMALPRAYTTRQSENMKALGDKIYGYYSHEKRSMMQAYSIGAMFWQMGTYWSSKKNLYLSGRGYTLLGEYRLYTETDLDGNVVKYYNILDDLNLLTPIAVKEGDPIPPNSTPLMKWYGRPQEGIIITAMHALRDLTIGGTDAEGNKQHGISYMMDDMFGKHVDPDLKNLYRANFKLLWYDLIMLLLMGMIVSPALLKGVQEHIKDVGNKDFMNAFINNQELLLASMLKTSTDDFNAVESICGKMAEWTPFSIKQMSSTLTNLGSAISGNKDFYDAAVGAMAATKQNKPILDFVKISMFDTPIGKKLGE